MQKIFMMLYVMTAVVWGDYTMVFSTNNDAAKSILKHHDKTHMKFESFDGKTNVSSLYVIADKAYIVSKSEDGLTYMDTDEMQKLLSTLGNIASYEMQTDYSKMRKESQFKILSKKGSKRVAGFKGEVWEVSYLEDGKTIHDEIVVTKDKELKSALHDWSTTVNRVLKPRKPLEIEKMFEIEPGYYVIKSNQMQLESFDRTKLASTELSLPKGAKKQSMPSFDFGSLMQSSSKGAESQTPKESQSNSLKDKGIDTAVEALKSFF